MFFADAWVIWSQIVSKIHIYRKMCQSAVFKAKVKGEGQLNFKVKLTIILLKVSPVNLVIILRSDTVFDKNTVALQKDHRRPLLYYSVELITYKEPCALMIFLESHISKLSKCVD